MRRAGDSLASEHRLELAPRLEALHDAADVCRDQIIGRRLNRQALATFGAAGVDDRPAATGLHADQEAMGARPAYFGGLVSAFHIDDPMVAGLRLRPEDGSLVAAAISDHFRRQPFSDRGLIVTGLRLTCSPVSGKPAIITIFLNAGKRLRSNQRLSLEPADSQRQAPAGLWINS